MFTLILQRKLHQPRALYFHAVTSPSSTLYDRSTLNRSFRDASIPEDTLIMDAAGRVLQQMNPVGDVEITRAYNLLQGLTSGPNLVPPAGADQATIDAIKIRIQPQSVPLSSLLWIYTELVETGWTGSSLDTFWQELSRLRDSLPGMSELSEAYRIFDAALDQYHRIADAHSSLTVLSPWEVETLNTELQAVTKELDFGAEAHLKWGEHGFTVERFIRVVETAKEQWALINSIPVERLLQKMKATQAYRILKNPSAFDKRFLAYYAQLSLERSNTRLEATKETIFGERRGEFEGMVHQARKASMDYILSLDPAQPDQLHELHQIFLTNRRYFQRTGNTSTTNPSNQIEQEQYQWETAVRNAVLAAASIPWADVTSIRNAGAAIWNTLVSSWAPSETIAAAARLLSLPVGASATPVSIVALIQSEMMPPPSPVRPTPLDWDSAMRTRLTAILQRYYPQMLAQYARPAVTSRIPWRSQSARSHDDLVTAIMDQNDAEALLYYTTNNQLRQTENSSTMQNAFRLLGFAGEKIGAFFAHDTTRKSVQAFMKGSKQVFETTLGWVGTGTSRVANAVGKGLAGTTGFLDKKTASVDAWAWKGREKGFWNTMGWMAKLPARPISKMARLLTWSTDGAIGKWVGLNVVAKWVDGILTWVKAVNTTANNVMAKIPDDEVTDAWSAIWWLLHKSGEWTGKLTDVGANWTFWQLKTEQKRKVLSQLRTLFDTVPGAEAWFQTAMFGTTMRSWGTWIYNPASTATPDRALDAVPAWTFFAWPAPVAPAWAPAVVSASTIRLSKKSVEAMIRGLVTSRTTLSSFLRNLKALLDSHPTSRLLKGANTAAVTRSTRNSPTIQKVLDAAIGAL